MEEQAQVHTLEAVTQEGGLGDELRRMQALGGALESAPDDERARLLRWANDRFGVRRERSVPVARGGRR
jgi:hypothetical protein